jgi:hypothetical protein
MGESKGAVTVCLNMKNSRPYSTLRNYHTCLFTLLALVVEREYLDKNLVGFNPPLTKYWIRSLHKIYFILNCLYVD